MQLLIHAFIGLLLLATVAASDWPFLIASINVKNLSSFELRLK